jgi:hypothetical protein
MRIFRTNSATKNTKHYAFTQKFPLTLTRENIMIDRLLPIFAVIGILSSVAYLSLAAWMIYENVLKKRRLIPL